MQHMFEDPREDSENEARDEPLSDASMDEEDWDDIKEWAGRRLLVLELDGSIRQIVRLPYSKRLLGLRFQGDTLYITENDLEEQEGSVVYVMGLMG